MKPKIIINESNPVLKSPEMMRLVLANGSVIISSLPKPSKVYWDNKSQIFRPIMSKNVRVGKQQEMENEVTLLRGSIKGERE
jgi:hypothetical protein|tara:strand:+ start:2259 stop:2504 length:246 start_codon:yes stop_codon:yes gene_type:complete